VKRKAYWRGDGWVDGIMYGILREDLEATYVFDEHIARFNAGVRSGDFGPMLEQFADDAELDILDVRHEGEDVVAGYAWRREPDTRAGALRLTVAGGRIRQLVVTFD